MAQELNTEVLTQFAPSFPQRLSYEDFLREFDGQYAEWVNFEIIKPMTVSRKHDDLTGFLRAALRIYVEVNNLGTIHGEPYQMKMTLPDGIHGREPDVFFVKKENAEKIGDKFFNGAADLTVEVVSGESFYRDTRDKFDEYQRAGVKEYWLIDPERRTARFYGLDEQGKYQLLSPDENNVFQSQMLKDLSLPIELLWQEPLPPLMSVLKEWKLI